MQTLRKEAGQKPEQLEKMADYVHDNHNIGAAPASGSFRTDGMIVVPCSMKTVAGIVSGYSDDLLLRAADVTLKECRRLVLVTRECPLSSIQDVYKRQSIALCSGWKKKRYMKQEIRRYMKRTAGFATG